MIPKRFKQTNAWRRSMPNLIVSHAVCAAVPLFIAWLAKRATRRNTLDKFLASGCASIDPKGSCDVANFERVYETFATATGSALGKNRSKWAAMYSELRKRSQHIRVGDGVLSGVRLDTTLPRTSPPLMKAFLTDTDEVTLHPGASCSFGEFKDAYLAYARSKKIPTRSRELNAARWFTKYGIKRSGSTRTGMQDKLTGLALEPRWTPEIVP